jgi:transposase
VPAHHSSQTCSTFRVVDVASQKGESVCCTGCGYVDHADLNAARVLKARANRSCRPTEASGLPSRRSGKVRLRAPRRPQSSALLGRG